MLPYAFAIFLGAFLLFQVQPLIGKYILPWFGGTPAVWTTCMLFFQTLLLAGYAYAHVSSTRLRPRQQGVLHLVLLGLSLALLPIVPSETWKPTEAGDPTGRILTLLTVCIGLPYFVLSATGPLLQHWFSRERPGASPYRLYALSNIGSLLALLSYPFFFEVVFTRREQAIGWSVGLGVFVAACGWCAWRVARSTGNVAHREAARPERSGERQPADDALLAADHPLAGALGHVEDGRQAARPGLTDRVLWVVLPAIASVLLLATTNKLCQDVAVIPFLWVLPLALYLLTFILCFDHARWYRRGVFAALLALGVGMVAWLLFVESKASLALQITGYAGTLFVACMVCHGEVYRLKPHPRFLTGYYLLISAGGALGGFGVAVIAPWFFNDYVELQAGLWLLTYAVGYIALRDRSRALAYGAIIGAVANVVLVPALRATNVNNPDAWYRFGYEFAALWEGYGTPTLVVLALIAAGVFGGRRIVLREWRPRLGGLVMLLSLVAGAVFVMQIRKANGPGVRAWRNFYGVLKVYDYNAGEPENHYRMLSHGSTTHGMQFVNPPWADETTSYYGQDTAAGIAINYLLPETPRHIGLVGLGTGSLAVYGREHDRLRIYEINPVVEQIARSEFSYLSRTVADVTVVLGDARLVMEQELARGEPQKFDLLALDAFSSDAIPVHLLTREAFADYLRHLAPDGVIAVHISNRYLDLRPVVENVAREFGLGIAVIQSEGDDDKWWIYRTTWVLLAKNPDTLRFSAQVRLAADEPLPPALNVPLWTDDHASILSVFSKRVKRAPAPTTAAAPASPIP